MKQLVTIDLGEDLTGKPIASSPREAASVKSSLILLLVALVMVGCGLEPTALPTGNGNDLGTQAPGASASPEPALTARADGLSEEEAATLDSLERVDAFPLYTMRYYAHYGQGLLPPDAAGRVTLKRWTVPDSVWACALFAALGDEASRLYGRNFDWQFSPALLLFTDPPDGYASVSMVDLAYLVGPVRARELMDRPLAERRELLEAPLWPFDGMNEQGLAVGMAAVTPGGMQPDPGKPTIGSLGIIREILDHAGNVEEALVLLQSYNIDMEGGPPLHYLLADRAGQAVLVEFYQGEMVLLANEAPWHLATNYLRAAVKGSTAGQCWRYDRIQRGLEQAEGRLGSAEALDLLAQASQDQTQWSVVYDMSSGAVVVAMGRQYASPHPFRLSPASEAGAP